MTMVSPALDVSLLFSIKLNYWSLIEQGLKDTELRRNALKNVEGREALIYVPRPVMEIRGGFTIGSVWTGTPKAVWRQVADRAGVEKEVFESYYAGVSIACALEITDVWSFERPIHLAELRARFHQFVVPQSWRYLRPEEHRSLRKRKREEGPSKSARVIQPPTVSAPVVPSLSY